MNFTYSGGTAQQVAWVQDAISRCSFPMANYPANVTVQWVSQMPPADLRHPYMVTQPEGSGNYLVSIIDWADDPTAPGNQGLPNPAADVQNFYEASFVHEIGHVAIDSSFNPDGADTDPRIATMCALYWTSDDASPTGKRTGAMADWDAPQLSWSNEIREAVAETFKVSFYGGDPIFLNRTNWHLDSTNWNAWLALFATPGGLTSSATASIDVMKLEEITDFAYSFAFLNLDAKYHAECNFGVTLGIDPGDPGDIYGGAPYIMWGGPGGRIIEPFTGAIPCTLSLSLDFVNGIARAAVTPLGDPLGGQSHTWDLGFTNEQDVFLTQFGFEDADPPEQSVAMANWQFSASGQGPWRQNPTMYGVDEQFQYVTDLEIYLQLVGALGFVECDGWVQSKIGSTSQHNDFILGTPFPDGGGLAPPPTGTFPFPPPTTGTITPVATGGGGTGTGGAGTGGNSGGGTGGGGTGGTGGGSGGGGGGSGGGGGGGSGGGGGGAGGGGGGGGGSGPGGGAGGGGGGTGSGGGGDAGTTSTGDAPGAMGGLRGQLRLRVAPTGRLPINGPASPAEAPSDIAQPLSTPFAPGDGTVNGTLRGQMPK